MKNAVTVEKESLYGVNKIFTNAMDWAGFMFPAESKAKQALFMKLHITGDACKGWGPSQTKLPVQNEEVQLRIVSPNGYPELYMKLPEHLYSFLLQDRKERSSRRDFDYEDAGWYRVTNHSSSVRDDSHLCRFFNRDSDFKIVAFGIGESDYNLSMDDEDYCHDAFTLSLLSDSIRVKESWELDSSSKWSLWTSFMKAMRKNHYTKGFSVQLTTSGEGEWKEKNILVDFDHDGKGKMFSRRVDDKSGEAKIYINKFSPGKLAKLFPNMKMNFVSSAFDYIDREIGKTVLEYTSAGYKVQVQDYSA
jgi:hypothetical protein